MTFRKIIKHTKYDYQDHQDYRWGSGRTLLELSSAKFSFPKRMTNECICASNLGFASRPICTVGAASSRSLRQLLGAHY